MATVAVKIFKLEEEEKPLRIPHLLRVFAEAAVLDSATRMGCWLVVGDAQASSRFKELAAGLSRFFGFLGMAAISD